MSVLGLVALLVLLYVIIKVLANPYTRPFVIGLGVLASAAVVFMYLSFHAIRVQDRVATIAPQHQPRPIAKEQASPPTSSPAEAKRPKMTVIAALRRAAIQAWAAGTETPVKADRDLPAGAPARGSQPPGWVNAASKMQDGCYTMSVHAGPFTTPLECERELPKALQGAVSEYAELALGREAASLRLPDDALQQLVHERWTDVRSMEIGGSSQDMFSLHALVVFDAPMQQRIKSEAQRLVISRRVQGAAVVFSGVLGLLALAWGGLKIATRRQEVK